LAEKYRSLRKIAEIADTIPKSYQSSIGDQIRRSCLSISANIAEATGRETLKERRYYFNVARGSVYETVSLLHILKSSQYINDDISEAYTISVMK